MRRKAVVASSELEGPGQVEEAGRGPGYAQSHQGLDRKLLKKDSLTHADLMGTSQQLSSGPRKGDALDLTVGRELMSPRPMTVRPGSTYGSGGPPVVPSYAHARGLSRPPPSAPFGNVLSPRSYHSSSYRDAALAAAQHGLSAYAASATAVAAAARGHQSRCGGGGDGGGTGAATGTAPGRPPPAPRPTQHSAPTPMACLPNGTEFLPSCSGASPSRGAGPPSRAAFLPSRCSAPPPGSPCRVGGAAAAAGDAATAAAAAAAAALPSHRSGDASAVTVAHNDAWWRSAFGDAPAGEQDDLSSTCPARPPSGTANAIRVMSPGWGTAPPSVFEADGRPGTRGGGPQYDIEGRPTTRGGQRPLSRAQLGLASAQTRLPAHVAPLVGPGWAGMFAGGCGTGLSEGGGTTVPASASASASAYTSPRAPSAGGSLRWSGDGAAEPPGGGGGAPRRQHLVPLPPAVPAGASRLASPPARSLGTGTGMGNTGLSSGGGVSVSAGLLTSLSSLCSGQSVGLPLAPTVSSAANGPQQIGLQPPGSAAGQLAGGSIGSCSSGSSSSGGAGTATAAAAIAGRAQLGTKLSSIAEGPNPPLVLPLPPSLHVQQQSAKGAAPRAADGRPSGAGTGPGAGGRKGPREREVASTDATRDMAASRTSYTSGGLEEATTDDSYRANPDQDAGANRGAPGRSRVRRSSSNTNTQTWQAHTQAPSGAGLRGPVGRSSHGGETAGGAQGMTGHGAMTDESPSNRPRR